MIKISPTTKHHITLNHMAARLPDKVYGDCSMRQSNEITLKNSKNYCKLQSTLQSRRCIRFDHFLSINVWRFWKRPTRQMSLNIQAEVIRRKCRRWKQLFCRLYNSRNLKIDAIFIIQRLADDWRNNISTVGKAAPSIDKTIRSDATFNLK